MKIVYLANAIIPSKTANSIHIMNMCSCFQDIGIEVTLVIPDRKGEYEENIDNIFEYYNIQKRFRIIKLKYYSNKYVNKLMYIYSMYKEVKNINPDLVYGRELYGCFVSSFNYNTSFEAHSVLNGFIRNKLFSIMSKNKNYNKTIVISNALKKIFIKDTDKDNIVVAHDGANEVTDFNTKVTLKGNNNNIKVGYIGHLYKGKGIEVIDRIQDKIPDNVEIHIVGGYKKDIEYWETRINSEKIFFYGFISPDKIGHYINTMDICLLPNQKVILPYGTKNLKNNISDFTSPLKMFEYMSYKKAIIASDLDVLKEVLTTNNAILCSPTDTDSWIEAINKFTNNNIRKEFANNAYNLFIQKYSWINRARNIHKKLLT